MGAPVVSAGLPVVLTIAGVDSSGGAGVVADLKTFEAHGLWGTVAVTAVTAQNTLGVQAVEEVSPELVRAQIASVVSDLGVRAAKTGMLGSAQVVEAVAETIRLFGVAPVVVDPVVAASTGEPLLAPDALESLRALLLPLATVVTPNVGEALALAGEEEASTGRADVERTARRLAEMGPQVVMVTGGHLDPGEGWAADCVVAGGEDVTWLEAPRLPAGNDHGTGCVLSAAICAELARGMEPVDACVAGKRFVEKAIAAAVPLGAGAGPVDPGWERRSTA